MDIGLPEQVFDDAEPGEQIFELEVIYASTEELTEHRRLLADIDNATKGGCVWSRLEAAA